MLNVATTISRMDSIEQFKSCFNVVTVIRDWARDSFDYLWLFRSLIAFGTFERIARPLRLLCQFRLDSNDCKSSQPQSTWSTKTFDVARVVSAEPNTFGDSRFRAWACVIARTRFAESKTPKYSV
jgi:hypothetical protein